MVENPSQDLELRRVYLFAGLDDVQLDQVKRGLRALRLAESERLFDHGQAAERFFLVRSGQIKLYRLSTGGAEKVIEIIQPGQTFAEAVVFMERQVYPVSAQALSPTELWSFENRAFLALLRQSSDTCFRLMAAMSMRLHAHINEINGLTLQNATLRLVGFLVRLMAEHGSADGRLELPAAKNVIASRLSVQPETLSRILHNLSADGVITVQGRVIQIHDLERLQGFLD